MAVLGLRFCARAFSSCGKWGPLFIMVRGALTIAASLVAEHRLQSTGSVVVAHGPSCSAACGIFPDQGSNPCPLHWQADSQPLHHQGSPCNLFYKSLTYHKCPFILVNRDLWQHFKGLWRWCNAFQLDFEGLGKCMGRIQLEEGGQKSKRLFQEG